VAGSSDHGNVPSGSKEGRELLDYLLHAVRSASHPKMFHFTDIMMNFIACILHLVLLGLLSQGG
jgi:hypothetical protein